MKDEIWVIGGGPMAQAYAEVLADQKANFRVVTSTGSRSESFEKIREGCLIVGGVENAIRSYGAPKKAIIALPIDKLASVGERLITAGIKGLLLEKPGALTFDELASLRLRASANGVDVYVGYNRRFFNSTIEARRVLEEDGGATSIHFEFTEWADSIRAIPHSPKIKERWLLANSTHIIDLAFYLAGKPVEANYFSAGELDWHKSSARFVGSGITDRNILFSYNSNWDSAGRWALEVKSKNFALRLCPVEEISRCDRGSVSWEKVLLRPSDRFKDGIYEQTRCFVTGDCSSGKLATIDYQVEMWPIYESIAGYH